VEYWTLPIALYLAVGVTIFVLGLVTSAITGNHDLDQQMADIRQLIRQRPIMGWVITLAGLTLGICLWPLMAYLYRRDK